MDTVQKKTKTVFGSFLVIGLIGIIIASIVNIFMASSGLAFVISIAGVIISGLTVYGIHKEQNKFTTVMVVMKDMVCSLL